MKRADEASKSKTIGNLVASFQRQVLTLLVLLILLVSLVQEHLLAGTKGQILTPEAGRAAVPDDH